MQGIAATTTHPFVVMDVSSIMCFHQRAAIQDPETVSGTRLLLEGKLDSLCQQLRCECFIACCTHIYTLQVPLPIMLCGQVSYPYELVISLTNPVQPHLLWSSAIRAVPLFS